MARSRRLYVSAAVIVLIILAIAVVQNQVPSRLAPLSGAGTAAPPSAPGSQSSPTIPDFAGGGHWFNSPPLSLADLKGQVVVVDFWTYSCVNCLRTLPYLKEWYAKYGGRGLTIIGVHSPEFDFERDPENVARAIAKYGVAWPVVMDNDYAIWQAYGNRYWPHKYIADAQGRLRYHHIGEGGYAETEEQIRELLAEAGRQLDDIPGGPPAGDGSGRLPITRELYAGLAFTQGEYLGNQPVGGLGDARVFADPHTYQEGTFYLAGAWVLDEEAARFVPQTGAGAGGRVVLRYRAAAVNAVLSSHSGAAAAVQVRLDGQPLPATAGGADVADGVLSLREARLYSLVQHPNIEEHVLELVTDSPDLVLYTFTFSGT